MIKMLTCISSILGIVFIFDALLKPEDKMQILSYFDKRKSIENADFLFSISKIIFGTLYVKNTKIISGKKVLLYSFMANFLCYGLLAVLYNTSVDVGTEERAVPIIILLTLCFLGTYWSYLSDFVSLSLSNHFFAKKKVPFKNFLPLWIFDIFVSFVVLIVPYKIMGMYLIILYNGANNLGESDGASFLILLIFAIIGSLFASVLLSVMQISLFGFTLIFRLTVGGSNNVMDFLSEKLIVKEHPLTLLTISALTIMAPAYIVVSSVIQAIS